MIGRGFLVLISGLGEAVFGYSDDSLEECALCEYQYKPRKVRSHPLYGYNLCIHCYKSVKEE